MLSEADEIALLRAVPSFEPGWRASEAAWADYVRRHPEEALAPAERCHEFLSDLAGHLGRRAAAGEVAEFGPLFAALEPLYARGDDALEGALTVGFLESLLYAVEHAGGDAARLHAVPKGPRAARGWQAAYAYVHPGRAAAGARDA